MSLDNIINQYDILMSKDCTKKEKKDAFYILTDYAHIQNASVAWLYLALYYINTEEPIGISLFGADRHEKAFECLKTASYDIEYRESAYLLTLDLFLKGSKKNLFKLNTLARALLDQPFNYDYEDQVSIFSYIIKAVNEDVYNGARIPSFENPDPKFIEKFIAVWSNYQKIHSGKKHSPDVELRVMNEAYAYAHYSFLEQYIEKKLLDGCQAAYWAYGVVFFSQYNHLMHPVRKNDAEYGIIEAVFINGLNKGDFGALRTILELYYQEDKKEYFSLSVVHQTIDTLRKLYPNEFKSLALTFKKNGITFS